MILQTGDAAENKRSRKRASTCFVHTYGCVLHSPLLLLRVNFLKVNYLSVRRTSEMQIKYYYRFQILYRAFSYNIIFKNWHSGAGQTILNARIILTLKVAATKKVHSQKTASGEFDTLGCYSQTK